jgi:hypothetical protein
VEVRRLVGEEIEANQEKKLEDNAEAQRARRLAGKVSDRTLGGGVGGVVKKADPSLRSGWQVFFSERFEG